MNPRKKVTLHSLRRMVAAGEQIAMLTAYDTAFARLLDEAGVDVILVGDSLGMVLLGHESTVAVTMDEMVHHTRAVTRGAGTAWVIADLPFGSYQTSASQAMSNAERLMQAGAQMVKLEGGGWTAPTVRFLVERGVPVCAHLGLTPQTVHALGGWRVQGRDEAGAATLKRQAAELAEAGASMMVLELMPTRVSRELAASVPIPMIGIGAGSGLAGQVLVLHDMLGITPEPRPRFVRNFMQGATSIADALARYVADVKAGTYPDDAIHGFV